MMSTFSVVLVFIVSFGFISETEARHGKYRGPRVDPALCSAQEAPWGCWPVPRTQDTLSRDAYHDTMSGKLTEVMWRIDAAGLIAGGILTYRYQYILTETGNDEYTYVYNFRTSPMEGANCSYVSAKGLFISQDKVILENVPPLQSDWRYWFMSDHPRDYIISFACYDKSKIRNGICYTQWFVEIQLPADKLDNPPMQCIVDEMWNKLGLKFSNELNTFLSIGYRTYINNDNNACDGSL